MNIATRRVAPSHQTWTPLPYMERARDFLVDHYSAGLPLAPGGRKTSITLAAFCRLQNLGRAKTMLVIAPLRVARQTWPAEVTKWSEFRHLKVSLLHGAKKKEALRAKADVYLINPEGVKWLCDQYFGKTLPFDVVCIDELTRFKNASSERSKALRPRSANVRYRWGLTGSLKPNTHMDLFGQQLILDSGEALGRYITHFRDKYFIKSFNGFTYDLVPGAEKKIAGQLAKTWFYMDPADYSQLPPLVENVIDLDLEPAQRKLYVSMKNQMIAALPSGKIEAVNAASCYSKLAQMANGAVYLESEPGQPRKVAHLHDVKLDALEELFDGLDGDPLLVGYEFNHDIDRIRARFASRLPGGVLPYLGKGTTLAEETKWIADWNAGRLPILCAHPACVHPDTLVLTEYRGWVRLITVKASERVFDGVEFVSHAGCQLSGLRRVINKLGITMTPDHLVLVQGEWRRADSVPDTPEARSEARYRFPRDARRTGALLPLWHRAGDTGAERTAGQQAEAQALPGLSARGWSRDGDDAPLPHLARRGAAVHQAKNPRLPALWRARDYLRSGVAVLSWVLGRYGEWLRRGLDLGAVRREWALYRSQLPLGYAGGAAGQQAHDAVDYLSWAADAPRGVLPVGGRDAWRDFGLSGREQRRGCGDAGLSAIDIPEGQEIEVFDLVDCGPRHRFLAKNADGEMFILHNSAGHGLNLQEGNAANVCWFSVSWDWELYDQFIRRIRRSGNEAQRIFNHLLVVRDSIDELKLAAQKDKDTSHYRLLATLNQEILRSPAQSFVGTTPTLNEETTMVAKLSRGSAPAQASAPAGWGAAPAAPQQPAQAPANVAPAGWGAAPAAPQQAAQTPVAQAPANVAPVGWGAAPAQPAASPQQQQQAVQGMITTGHAHEDPHAGRPDPAAQARAAFGGGVAAMRAAIEAQAYADPQQAAQAPQGVAPAGWGAAPTQAPQDGGWQTPAPQQAAPARVPGQSSPGKARRTKAEMEEDAANPNLQAAAQPAAPVAGQAWQVEAARAEVAQAVAPGPVEVNVSSSGVERYDNGPDYRVQIIKAVIASSPDSSAEEIIEAARLFADFVING